LCICECLRRGYDAVDFLAGDTEHKRRLSTHHAELAWVVWRRPNLKNSAIDAMRRIKQVASTIRSLRFGIAESASTEIPTESSENRQAD
jgi:CelD/BcsL family acetyltransferase involved in cellulose biosynthesis